MSDGSAALRRKIDSAQKLQSVVRTMKAVAASSIGQYEEAVRALEHYARTVELGLLASLVDTGPIPAQQPRSSTKLGAVVFGSDQGLVGAFNEVICRHALAKLKTLGSDYRIWAVGEHTYAELKDSGVNNMTMLAVPRSVQAIGPLIGRILSESEAAHTRGELGELHLFFNRPTVHTKYEPVDERLLPLDENWHRRFVEQPWPSAALPEVIGDRAAMVSALIREYLYIWLFRATAASLASENASRLAAMQRADKNIGELLTELRRTFHRSRQRGIDDELFDVISGFEAFSAEELLRSINGSSD